MANLPKFIACASDEALVKPEIGSTEQAGVEPKVKSNGYVAMLSVGYRF